MYTYVNSEHMKRVSSESRGVRSPGTGVSDGCKQPIVGAEN